MSEEEKEAIEQLKSWRNHIVKNKDKVNRANDIEFYLRTALNLIQNQQAELEKKDKIIDEMAEVIDDTFIADKICEECIKAKLYEEIFEYECEKERKICIKQYFEGKVKKSRNADR